MNIELPKTWKEKLAELDIEGSAPVDNRDSCYSGMRALKLESPEKVFTIRAVGDKPYVFRLDDVVAPITE